jgi:hypothetical protein
VLAACGGGSKAAAPSTGDVAVVGSDHISTADFNAVMASTAASYKQQGQAFPKQGTSAYESIKSQAVTLLVQRAERALEAKKEGIVVTDADVTKRLNQIKKQFFKGSEKEYKAQLKKAKLTEDSFRADIRQQILEERLYNKITKDVKVPESQIKAYYQSHISSYEQPASRDVQYMLIKKKALAQSLYTALKANPKLWCPDAKKYSGDPSSKNNCGKATFTKGSTVGAFDTVLFTEKTNVIHPPVYDSSQYKAYFLIRPLSAVKPGKTSTLKEETPSIRQTLLQTAKADAVTKWSKDLQKQYCSGSTISYQVGYQPNPDPCTPPTTSTSATTTAP